LPESLQVNCLTIEINLRILFGKIKKEFIITLCRAKNENGVITKQRLYRRDTECTEKVINRSHLNPVSCVSMVPLTWLGSKLFGVIVPNENDCLIKQGRCD